MIPDLNRRPGQSSRADSRRLDRRRPHGWKEQRPNPRRATPWRGLPTRTKPFAALTLVDGALSSGGPIHPAAIRPRTPPASCSVRSVEHQAEHARRLRADTGHRHRRDAGNPRNRTPNTPAPTRRGAERPIVVMEQDAEGATIIIRTGRRTSCRNCGHVAVERASASRTGISRSGCPSGCSTRNGGPGPLGVNARTLWARPRGRARVTRPRPRR